MDSKPRARSTGLLTQPVGDELVVHDVERQQLHTLNAAAALIWQHCDGRNSVEELAAVLADELRIAPDESVVRLALDDLREAQLLDDPGEAHAAGMPRRTFFKRAAAVAAGAVLPPVVTTFGTAPAYARGRRVTLCHGGRTIEVDQNAVQSHLDHGDTLGPCGSTTTAAPTTVTPTTLTPTTVTPTTAAPTTAAPTTSAPTTAAPTTAAPTTSAPTTSAPTTSAPTTSAPTPP